MGCFTTWTVLPHEPLQKLSDNFWCVQGTMPDGKAKRKMSVMRLADGSLMLHNVIALEEPHMQDLEAFGKPSYIVVPNGFHRQDARIWKDRYPSAKVIAPVGSRKKVGQIVPVDLDYKDAPSDASVKLSYFDGTKQKEGYAEVRSADGTTLVINDVILNMPKMGGLFGFLLGPTGQPSVPRFTRWFVAKDNGALGEHIERLSNIADLRRVVLSHGQNLEQKPAEALKTARATV
jgi:hypothetical protein